MRRTMLLFTLTLMLTASGSTLAADCFECHSVETPQIVIDWKISLHSQNDIGCEVCHGEGHQSAADAAMVEMPTAATCGECHDTQLTQFSKGKHALAWAA